MSGDIIDLDAYRRRRQVPRPRPVLGLAATVAGVALVELGRELALPEGMPRPLLSFLSRLIGGEP